MKKLIYQLFVRHFGNTQTSLKEGGDITENGCGKFEDITTAAIIEIKKMGFTHIWLTGVIDHACGTSYPDKAADNDKILKGKAGSPYAIRDYFDICRDLAVDVDKRMDEFKALIKRIHLMDLKVIIDFVPNHVARSYKSVMRPELTFGLEDDTQQFCAINNHYYYLSKDEEVQLPGGAYPIEKPPKVTGNNAVTSTPSQNDWYETVKLNYGYDFVNNIRLYADGTIPSTWKMMDQVLAYWQEIGVDGFRCDMAHMVPVGFWQYAISMARDRSDQVFFIGEAYANDPMKVAEGKVLSRLLSSGFDEVYDSQSYDVVKDIYEKGKWANDLDDVLWDQKCLHQMTRYAENHDEVRLGNPKHWGGHGAKIGSAVCGFLYGIGSGGCLFYNGQEVGEKAEGVSGFSKDDGKTSIFDYTALPEFQKWVNGHKYNGGELDEKQTNLREWYTKWFKVMKEPAFHSGGTYGLNSCNRDNEKYGRLEGESISGHWLYSFLRYDRKSGQAFLVVINFHPTETMNNVEIFFSKDARMWLGDYDYEHLELEDVRPCEVITYCMKHIKK